MVDALQFQAMPAQPAPVAGAVALPVDGGDDFTALVLGTGASAQTIGTDGPTSPLPAVPLAATPMPPAAAIAFAGLVTLAANGEGASPVAMATGAEDVLPTLTADTPATGEEPVPHAAVSTDAVEAGPADSVTIPAVFAALSPQTPLPLPDGDQHSAVVPTQTGRIEAQTTTSVGDPRSGSDMAPQIPVQSMAAVDPDSAVKASVTPPPALQPPQGTAGPDQVASALAQTPDRGAAIASAIGPAAEPTEQSGRPIPAATETVPGGKPPESTLPETSLAKPPAVAPRLLSASDATAASAVMPSGAAVDAPSGPSSSVLAAETVLPETPVYTSAVEEGGTPQSGVPGQPVAQPDEAPIAQTQSQRLAPRAPQPVEQVQPAVVPTAATPPANPPVAAEKAEVSKAEPLSALPAATEGTDRPESAPVPARQDPTESTVPAAARPMPAQGGVDPTQAPALPLTLSEVQSRPALQDPRPSIREMAVRSAPKGRETTVEPARPEPLASATKDPMASAQTIIAPSPAITAEAPQIPAQPVAIQPGSLLSAMSETVSPSPSAPVRAEQTVPVDALPALLVSRTDGGPAEIHLEPLELGRLRLDVVADGQEVQVTLAAERSDTADFLRRFAAELASEFRQAGFVQVTVGFGAWGEGRGESRPQDMPQPPQSGPQNEPQANIAAPVVATLVSAQTRLTSRGLNLRL